jgi:hypothetical protein
MTPTNVSGCSTSARWRPWTRTSSEPVIASAMNSPCEGGVDGSSSATITRVGALIEESRAKIHLADSHRAAGIPLRIRSDQLIACDHHGGGIVPREIRGSASAPAWAEPPMPCPRHARALRDQSRAAAAPCAPTCWQERSAGYAKDDSRRATCRPCRPSRLRNSQPSLDTQGVHELKGIGSDLLKGVIASRDRRRSVAAMVVANDSARIGERAGHLRPEPAVGTERTSHEERETRTLVDECQCYHDDS